MRFEIGFAFHACLVHGRTRAGVKQGGVFAGREKLDKVAVKAKCADLSKPACLRVHECITGVPKICVGE